MKNPKLEKAEELGARDFAGGKSLTLPGAPAELTLDQAEAWRRGWRRAFQKWWRRGMPEHRGGSPPEKDPPPTPRKRHA